MRNFHSGMPLKLRNFASLLATGVFLISCYCFFTSNLLTYDNVNSKYTSSSSITKEPVLERNYQKPSRSGQSQNKLSTASDRFQIQQGPHLVRNASVLPSSKLVTSSSDKPNLKPVPPWLQSKNLKLKPTANSTIQLKKKNPSAAKSSLITKAQKIAAPSPKKVPVAKGRKQKVDKTLILKPSEPMVNFSSIHYTFTVANSRICDQFPNIPVITFVTSSPSNIQKRQAVRETWGQSSVTGNVTKVLFLLGNSTNETLQRQVLKESVIYKDLVVGNFTDAYLNLTLKTMFMLQWLQQFCSQVPLVLKTDDDVFIKMDNFKKFVDKYKDSSNTMYGFFKHNILVKRGKANKYYIPRSQVPNDVYPDFLTGPAYLFTNDITGALFNKALSITYFHLEDVFITGFVAEALGIKRQGTKEFTNTRLRELLWKKKGQKPLCSISFVISIHDLEPKMMKQVFEGFKKCP